MLFFFKVYTGVVYAVVLCMDVTGLFETAAKISRCVVAVRTAAPPADMDIGDGEGHGEP